MKASLVVAREIVQAIADQGLQPGDRYLSESEGLKVHGVGRGTYREALRFLELQGVIVIRSGPTGGVEISRPDWRNLASTVALLMQFADAPLRSILEARIAVDPGMAALAAANATDEEIRRMADALDLVDAHVGHYDRWSAAYNGFWELLASSTHNPLLASLGPALRVIVNAGGFVPNERYRGEVNRLLRTLHGAVAARDAAAARDLMLAIDRSFEARLREGYPQQVDRVVSWSDIAALHDPEP